MSSVIIAAAHLMAPATTAETKQQELRLPALFNNDIVLQRDTAVSVWGWAAPAEEVTVKVAGQEVTTKTDDRGRWSLKLAPMKAGEAGELTVTGGRTNITIRNVLIGDVWICAGQSNMGMNLNSAATGREAAAAANFPRIRHLSVTPVTSRIPLDEPNLKSWWTSCSPVTAGSFSAVAFFFGREIHQQLQVPVGLIHASWGGTTIEPWTPQEGFAAVQELNAQAKDAAKNEDLSRKELLSALDKLDIWSASTRRALAGKEAVPIMPNVGGAMSTPGSCGIYNSMIHPITPYTIRGIIWYQGESNVGNGLTYRKKMEALITGWRKAWKQGDIPFYYVQIPPYSYGAGQLPLLWEAQTLALEIPNTGMAATTDLGDKAELHPKKKEEIGYRLALQALAGTYGKDTLVHSGPRFKSMTREAGQIRIAFTHTGSGLVARDGKPLDWFEIAGEDKKFVQANAVIDGETIVVSNDQVANPIAVRFGWDNLASPNLFNRENLPALPFRTDNW